MVDERDRNYWGLTFAADGDTFYATMATGKQTWLIKGSISKQTAHTIHDNVECPSLSPDGTRIGYKKAVGHNPTVWRFHVLDLATGKETRSPRRGRSTTRSNGSTTRTSSTAWRDDLDRQRRRHRAPARLWLPEADSPAVVRP